MPHTWHAIETRTGKRGPQLHVQTRGTVSRIIGEATDTQLGVLCWDGDKSQPVPDWRQNTQPGLASMVLVDEDDTPLWLGDVVRRIPDPSIWVPVTLVTTESYADRRFAGTLSYFAQDQAAIAANLVNAIAVNGPVPPWTYDVDPTGVLRDRVYLDSDDKTVLSLLSDLMALEDPLEFTVDVEWADAQHSLLRRVWRFSSHVGTSLPYPTRFEHPGPVTSFTVTEDYGKDTGANDVQAVSSGEAGARPQSSHATDARSLAAGVRYERRFTPSTSITDVATLNSYARAELERTRDGLTEISLVTNLDAGPRLNSDWWLGDDITAVITAPAYPEQVGPDGERLPGYERVVRVVGWSIDLDARTLTPKLREYDE